MLNKKVTQFDFAGLVDRFDSARAATPTISKWALTNALLDFNLSSSDSAALGGDLAYEYGKNGNLANVGMIGGQNVLNNTQLGSSPQTFQTVTGLQEGIVKLG